MFHDKPLAVSRKPAFTLLELLLSIGLVLILAAVAVWAINPLERLRQSRDRQRLADLAELQAAIQTALESGQSLGSTFGVVSGTVGVEKTFDSSGSGWVPMDLSSSFPKLPNDPRGGERFEDVLGDKILGEYQFISDGKYYVIRTHLEAEINLNKYAEDGNDNTWYEVGDAPGLSTYFGL